MATWAIETAFTILFVAAFWLAINIADLQDKLSKLQDSVQPIFDAEKKKRDKSFWRRSKKAAPVRMLRRAC
jgi:hypothetical protein